MALSTLKDDITLARKARDTKRTALLTTVLSGIEALVKGVPGAPSEPTDAQTVGFIQKLIKDNKASLEQIRSSGRASSIEDLVSENEILSKYVPSMMTSEELASKISDFVAGMDAPTPKEMGKVMGYLKSNFSGQYDGKEASRLVREALS